MLYHDLDCPVIREIADPLSRRSGMVWKLDRSTGDAWGWTHDPEDGW